MVGRMCASCPILVATLILSVSQSLHHWAEAQDVPKASSSSGLRLQRRRHLAWQELDCPTTRPVPSPEDFIPAGDVPVDLGDETSIRVVGTTIAKASWRCQCNATLELPSGVEDGDRLFLFVGASDGLNGAWTDAQDSPSSRLGRLVSDGWEPILQAGSTDLNVVALTKIHQTRVAEQSKSSNVARGNTVEAGDSDGAANICTTCSNTPSPKMIEREQNCSTYQFAFTDRCGNAGSWWGRKNKPKYCQYSCWSNDAGYAEDIPCCERSDADDFVLGAIENNAQQGDDHEGDGLAIDPPSTLTVISGGVRNTWLTMVAVRGVDPERPVRGTGYLKTKSAKTCKTGEAMAPGLKMARRGAFLVVLIYDDPHRSTIISPEKSFHLLASYSSGDDGMAVAISGEPTSGLMMEDVKAVGQSKLSGGGQAIGVSLSLRGEKSRAS